MYRYETHMHTAPVSRCARADVKSSLEFYKKLGYKGVFITNHFLDGNVRIDDPDMPYADKIEFYFSDYEKAKEMEDEIGIDVFCGVEMSYKGTDFLVFGLDKEWYLAHPEIMDMQKSEELPYLMEHGAFVSHAHPYREDFYIDHIRLFPRQVNAVEVVNANRKELENYMARHYAEQYGFYMTAGSDNHQGPKQKKLAGMEFDEPLVSVEDFIERIKAGKSRIFTMEL